MLWACLILENPTIVAMLQDSAAAIEKKTSGVIRVVFPKLCWVWEITAFMGLFDT